MASLGQNRVRIGFNPGGNDRVSEIKILSAQLIDICSTIQGDAVARQDGETARLCAHAMTQFEDACMWAVKAATS